jgi:tyrosinase
MTGLSRSYPSSQAIKSWLTERYSFAFDGLPYTIYFFLGEKDTFDTFSGPPHKHPQHVGFVYTFSNPAFGVRAGGGGCKKCLVKSREGTLSRAQIPLTATLVARSRTKTWANTEAGEGPLEGIHALANLEKHEVGKYLEKFLHWRVKSVGYQCLSHVGFNQGLMR